jgi:phosphatidate cytidylyltransferase
VWLLLVVWTTDIGAYFAGRSIGGPKLAPRISPGKTWAGLVGGMAAAGLVGGLLTALAGAGFWLAAGLGALLAAVAQAGDLFESRLKRHAGVKDSGHLIPGHGGLLDRIDGLVFAAPTFALVVALMGQGAAP